MGQTVYLAECEWVLSDSESEKYPGYVLLERARVRSQRDLTRGGTVSPTEHAVPPAVAAAGGAAVGRAVVAGTGMTAAGMVGSGSGFGAAAGPIGIAVGALAGLAVYGILRALGDMSAEQRAVQEWLAAEQ